MIGRISLRVAAVLSLLLTIAHTFGFTQAGHDPAQLVARHAMESTLFAAGGSTRTYWDFYVGFGLIISAFILAQGIILWLLAQQDKRRPGERRAIIAVLLLCNLAVLALDWRYLFAAPLIVTAVITVAIGLGLFTVGRGAGSTLGSGRSD